MVLLVLHRASVSRTRLEDKAVTFEVTARDDAARVFWGVTVVENEAKKGRGR